jgi:uncharacterized membrane protein YkvA (DUF1232 family)
MSKSNNGTNSQLKAYMVYMPDDGFDLEQFVEQGGCLAGREHAAITGDERLEVHRKISVLGNEHPRLARQLEFFAHLVAVDPKELPAKARNEIIFALLYAAAEADLIPDVTPEIGYSDDAAVAELVLSRHSDVFEEYCTASHLDWTALKP